VGEGGERCGGACFGSVDLGLEDCLAHFQGFVGTGGGGFGFGFGFGGHGGDEGGEKREDGMKG
jgi:hypothetical protein